MAISAGTVFINVAANIGPFRQQMLGLGSQVGKVGSTISRVGLGLSRALTIPIGLAGAAATKLALDYETAFVKIDAITNASQKQIGTWKDSVLDLAGKTAQAPEELANALYTLASAGLDAKEIFPALQASSKAAAVGLGDVNTVARLVTAAMNAYHKEGLKAAEVTDILVAAVREGRAEPDEFGDAIGRIIPIATKAGVSFDEVAASLAAVSNIGLDVNEGVTAMRGLMKALIVPGTQAAETLKKIGISTVELRDMLAHEGLLGVMQTLEKETKDEFGKSWLDAMNKIIPNIRALTGGLGLTVQEAEKVQRIFDQVAHSVGDSDKAFEKTTKGPLFQFQQMLTKLKVAGIKLGQALLPILIQLAEQIEKWAKAFTNLSPSMQSAIVKWGIFLALLGPALRIIGGITTGISALVQAGKALAGIKLGASLAGVGEQLTLFGPAAAAGGSIAGPIAAGIAVIAAVGIAAKIAIDNSNEAIDKNVELQRQGKISGQDLVDTNAELNRTYDAYAHTLNEGVIPAGRASVAGMQGIQNQVDANQKSIFLATQGYRDMAESFGATGREQSVLASVFKTSIGTTEEYRHHIAALVGAYHLYGTSIENVTADHFKSLTVLGKNAQALGLIKGKVSDETFALIKGKLAVGQYADAYDILTANFKDNTLQQVKNLLAVGDLQGAWRILKRDFNEATKEVRHNQEATRKNAEEQKNLDMAIKIAAHTGRSVKSVIKDLGDEAKPARTKIRGLSDEIQNMPKSPKIKPTVDASGATEPLNRLNHYLQTITNKDWVANVRVTTTGGSTGFHLLEMLDAALTAVSTEDWVANVAVALKDNDGDALDLPTIKQAVADMKKVMETLASSTDKVATAVKDAIGEKLPKSYADSARALQKMVADKGRHFTHLINIAVKAFDKIKAKADEFRDALKSAFDQFDLLAGATTGLGETIKQGQLDALNAQLEAVKDQEVDDIRGFSTKDPALLETDEEVKKRIDDEAEAISDQIKALEEAIIIPTADQLKEFFRQQVDQAGQFARVLKELQLAGLDPKLLADIATQGISALPFAQQLLSDPTLLQAFETAQNAIDQFAKKTSEALTTAQFGEKMKKLAKHVDDLSDKIREFNNRMERRMEELVEAIKSEKIANKLDQFVNAIDNAIDRISSGGGKGAKNMASGGVVTSATLIRAGEAGPEAIIPLSRMGGVGSDLVVNVYVEGNAIYSRDLANEVRDTLLKDKRFKGTLGLG